MTDQDMTEQCRRHNREMGPWIEPLQSNEREALELFCETVRDLEAYPLYQKLLRHNAVSSDIEVRDGGVVHASIRELDENDLRAFVLTARLFGQDNDEISIRKVAEIFDRRVSKRLLVWMNFNGFRLGWNQFRDQKLPDIDDTMGNIFDVFLYGHYAHKQKKKRAVYQEWKRTPDGFVARQTVFLIALGTFFWIVQGMRECVRQLLSSRPFG